MYGTQIAQTIPPQSLDSDQSHFLRQLAGSDLTVNRDLTWVTGDSDRQATLQGDPTLDDWFDQSIKIASSPTFAGLVLSGMDGVVQASAGVLTGSAGFSDLAPASADVDMGSFAFTARQLQSDIPGGTAPLIVASSTVVTNLNADLLDGNHASAFATSSHAHALDGLSDVDTTGASTGNFLQKSAGDWVDFDLFGTANTFTALQTFANGVTIENGLIVDSAGILLETGTGFTVGAGDLEYSVTTGNAHHFLVDGGLEVRIAANQMALDQGATDWVIDWGVTVALKFKWGALFPLQLVSGGAQPGADNTYALGSISTAWADLHLADDGACNFRGSTTHRIRSNTTNELELRAPTQINLQIGSTDEVAITSAGIDVVNLSKAETFESDVATGTAPIVAASTTVCPNLNADQVDGKHASDFVLDPARHIKATMTAGEAISAGDVVYISAANTVKRMTISNASKYFGVAEAAINNTEQGEITVAGKVTITCSGTVAAGDLVSGASTGDCRKYSQTSLSMASAGNHAHELPPGSITPGEDTEDAGAHTHTINPTADKTFATGQVIGRAITGGTSTDIDVLIGGMFG